MINFSKFNSLYSVALYFNTESKCQQAIVESRWGDDVVCPYCGNAEKLKFYNSQLEYVCEPGEFQVMVGPNSRDVKTKTFTLK